VFQMPANLRDTCVTHPAVLWRGSMPRERLTHNVTVDASADVGPNATWLQTQHQGASLLPPEYGERHFLFPRSLPEVRHITRME
jgi:hypothetical protein